MVLPPKPPRVLATVLTTLLIATPAFFGRANRVSHWPVIKPLELKYHFESIELAKLKTTIHGIGGKPLYILECYSFQAIPQTGEFMYSGDFECRLHSFNNRDRESTLLTELPDADRDWESRGRFLVEQLLPPCGSYQELGRKRSFRLRGFRLELILSNVGFDGGQTNFSGTTPRLKSFDLEVRVQPDSTATSPIAVTPALPESNTVPEQCKDAFDTLYLQRLRK